MLNILSLGAGVQSSTIAMMASHGEIAPPDCAIFADTGEEPKAVYRHLEWLMEPGRLPFPVHLVRAWEGYGTRSLDRPLGDAIIAACNGGSKVGSHARPPFFVLGKDGKQGVLPRQCTGDYKIDPIQRKIRNLLGLKFRQRWPNEIRVIQWIGISTDEATRMKPATVKRKVKGKIVSWVHPTIKNRWPLIEKLMSRNHCLSWWEKHKYPAPPKSACTFCPYHSDAQWRAIKAVPEEWKRAVEIDRAIRYGLKSKSLMGDTFLHRSLQPLDEVDLSTAEERGQINLFENECEGMCGV